MKKHFGLSHLFPDTQSFSHEISTHSCLSFVSSLPPTPCTFSKEFLPVSSVKLAFCFLLRSDRTKSSMEGEAQEEEWFEKTEKCCKQFSWASIPVEDFLCFPKINQLPSPANTSYLSSCFSEEFLS